MSRRSLKSVQGVAVHGIADKGKGVGRSPEGIVCFVEGAVPGDVVDVFVQKKKTGIAHGTVSFFHERSSDRTEPFCQHFASCGGCKWQNFDYAKQLEHKNQAVRDALRRIGKVEPKEWLPILGAEETVFYRNKLEFAFSPKRWLTAAELADGLPKTVDSLGFHVSGAFDKVIDIEKCWLMAEQSNAVRNGIKAIAIEQGLSFYDVREHRGLLRNLMLRLTTTGELMALFSFGPGSPKLIEPFLSAVAARFPAITTIVHCLNPKANDTVFDLEMKVFKGPGFVTEQLGELRFKIGPKSFFQTNSRQGKRLYDVAKSFAELRGDEVVYDLYTGTGSIALYLAAGCRSVVGIEEIPEAIDDARENQQLNGISNAVFYAGDVKDVLSEDFRRRHGSPDLIVTDPPRAGMQPKALAWLLELAAPRIVYVSCNPATQARDLQALSEKYEVLKSQAVDMFPHTHHIENVVLLNRKD